MNTYLLSIVMNNLHGIGTLSFIMIILLQF